MNYELAKKLKDAGFPQNTSEFEYANYISQPPEFKSTWTRHIRGSVGQSWEYDNARDYIACPTLSELIEACGESIDMITRKKTAAENRTLGWRAYCHKGPSISREGESPEEAVARLWIALNSNGKHD